MLKSVVHFLLEIVMNKQSGFTLIELIIVLAICGILLSVAYPAYQEYILEQQSTEIKEDKNNDDGFYVNGVKYN